MGSEFDAILVGAGHNALACAVHLAARGWRVAVIEGNAEPGGAVKSGDYTIPGFRHDWAAMNLSLFGGSTFLKTHGVELARHGLEFVPVNRPFASAFPDGSWCGVSTDLAETTANIARHAPQDAKTWERLLAEFPQKADTIFGLLGSPMRVRPAGYFIFKTLRKLGLRGTAEMARFLVQSPRDWLEDTFDSPQVRAMLAAWGLHLDYAPDIAGGGLFPYLEGMAGQAFGMVIGKGGADTVSRALVAALRARGGVVQCGTPVTRILHEGGTATGVELADGQKITATKAVIAGTSPSGLARLTGNITPEFDRAMTKFSHAPGTMMIHLAMAGLPDWAASPDLQRYAYVHIAPNLDQMARTYQQARAGLLPDEPVLVVGQPTVFDPSRAPLGQHVLWVQVRMAPGRIQGDAKGEIQAQDWTAAGPAFAARALDILERHAPGTKAKILGQRIVTPTELEADNPNLVGGDQLCGSHHLGQHFLFRPALGHADGSTPIRNLHLTGAAVWPGAGTGAGSGFLLARKLVGN